mmetsp:Transcript_6392/g.22498  ORF Transcript_6392/g.22498 Transcript_6392/m.22498 type:complete len:247 (+) Transcript_6392:1106-1846(+)
MTLLLAPPPSGSAVLTSYAVSRHVRSAARNGFASGGAGPARCSPPAPLPAGLWLTSTSSRSRAASASGEPAGWAPLKTALYALMGRPKTPPAARRMSEGWGAASAAADGLPAAWCSGAPLGGGFCSRYAVSSPLVAPGAQAACWEQSRSRKGCERPSAPAAGRGVTSCVADSTSSSCVTSRCNTYVASPAGVPSSASAAPSNSDTASSPPANATRASGSGPRAPPRPRSTACFSTARSRCAALAST